MSANVVFDNPNNEDPIDALPVDQNPPSQSEIQILDTLFKQTHTTTRKIFEGTKDVMLVGFLYILFSLPQIDTFVYKIAPSSQASPYILLFVKSLIYMLVYFVIKYMYLVRK